MKKLIVSILITVLLLSFCACNTPSDVNPQPSQPIVTQPIITQPPTAYEQLNEKEKRIFDALIIATEEFKNPSTVRLLDFDIIVDTVVDGSEMHFITVKLQAAIPAGGEVSENYILYLDKSTFSTGHVYYKGDIEGWDYDPSGAEPGVERSKINKALIEYWEEQGLA